MAYAATKCLSESAREALDAALISGARSRRIGIVERALEMGADANASDAFGLSAMHLAANANDTRMIKTLMRYGAKIGDTGKSGFSAFCTAALSGRLGAMRLLAAHGMDLEQCTSDERNMLEMTLIAGKTDAAAWLMDQGADLEAPDFRSETLVVRMISGGNDKAALLLAAKGACIDGGVIALLRSRGRADLVRQFIPFLALQSPRRSGRGSSGLASSPGHENGCEHSSFWLDEPDAHDTFNFTSAPLARPIRSFRSAFTLIACSAREFAHAASRLTKDFFPSQAAKARRADRLFAVLLAQCELEQARALILRHSSQMSLDHRSGSAMTPLQLLVQAACRLCTPCSGAQFNDALPHFSRVIFEIAQAIDGAKGARVQTYARHADTGNTVLHELIAKGHCALAMHLLGLDLFKGLVNTSNQALSRPLHLAVLRQDPHLMRALVDAGANLNAFDRSGQTPLHQAAFMLKIQCAEEAVMLGANVNLPTRKGASLDQIIAQRKGSSETLKSMVQARRTIESAKSIFSANNPMAFAARTREKII